MANIQCPDQFVRVAKLLEYNSLFGMQFFVDQKQFVPCLCDDAIKICNQMKIASGCQTLEAGDFIGYEYFTVAWYEYDKIPNLYNALIKANISFTIKYNHTFHGYCCKYEKPYEYTQENMEKRFVSGMERLLNSTNYVDTDVAVYELEHNCVIFDPWNYTTDEGKVFCEKMCLRCSKPYKPMDHPENYKLWSWYQPLTTMINDAMKQHASPVGEAPTNLPTGEASTNPPAKDTYMQQFVPDEPVCLICYENKPNTKVMPCGHVVVCETCSRHLSKTADHDICIRCRRPIEFITYATGELKTM